MFLRKKNFEDHKKLSKTNFFIALNSYRVTKESIFYNQDILFCN